MVNKLLKELKDKIKKSVDFDGYISIDLNVNGSNDTLMRHVVKSDSVLVSDKNVSIEADHFIFNFDCGKDVSIYKEEFGFDENYTIKIDNLKLCMMIMGT